MKIGIMQPYFFPYIGYFQLIHAVDIFVNLEHVNFMKRSYMTRNLLKDNISINIPVSSASQNKKCNQVNVLADEKWFAKFEKTLSSLYAKSPYYEDVIDQVYFPFKKMVMSSSQPVSISEFNIISISQISNYLDCFRRFESSIGITDRKSNEGLQDIVRHYCSKTYINAIGGQKLYNKADFLSQGIDLHFIKMSDLEVDNPYSSILDLLFRYSKEHVKKQLTKYTFI